jgi:hypothetical protein
MAWRSHGDCVVNGSVVETHRSPCSVVTSFNYSLKEGTPDGELREERTLNLWWFGGNRAFRIIVCNVADPWVHWKATHKPVLAQREMEKGRSPLV